MRAWELHQEGWSGKDIAAALKVSAGAVSGWLKRARAGGIEALRRRPAPGPTPKLTAEQRAALPCILAKGAEAYDFVGDVWTTKRVAVVIKRLLGVSYHPAHISRLLRQEGLSLQKPIRRASQRDEAKITAWRDQTWPALQAKPRRRSARSSS
jgi:transposase